MRALVKRSDADCELFPAIRAMIPARPHRLAAQGLNRLKLPAKRTNRAIRPAALFEVLAVLIFVGKGRVGEVAHGSISQLSSQYSNLNLFSQVYKCLKSL